MKLILNLEKSNFLDKKKSLENKTLLAENVGFEPTVPLGTTVFKTAAIDHSANSPGAKLVILWILTSIKLKKIQKK